jgi:fructose transport system ATP-binding protein
MTATTTASPVIEASGLVRTYGRVVALDAADFAIYPGEVLAVIGDNGAGKSTLIKCLSGAETPQEGEVKVDGSVVHFRRPQDAKAYGIETVYQTLAVAPALDIASNMYLGREVRKAGPLGSILRMVDGGGMRKSAKEQMTKLGIGTLQNMGQAVGSSRMITLLPKAAARATATA